MKITTRLATFEDTDFLLMLIARSVRGLSEGYYTTSQIESAINYLFGIDTQLLLDGTYYVAESAGTLIACGGWSRRETLFGGDQHKSTADPLLNPAIDAARIRAFFVDPQFARHGIGRMMMELCETAARNDSFTKMELGATLPGVPLYEAMGYNAIKKIEVRLPDGEVLEIVKMGKELN